MNDDPAAGPEILLGVLRVRFLGLHVGLEADAYAVSVYADGLWQKGRLVHLEDRLWSLNGDPVSLDSPDAVFRTASGHGPADVASSAPFWPPHLVHGLGRRRCTGPCVVAFDAAWFLSQLSRSTIEVPVLFPGAATKLGLAGLQRARRGLEEAGDVDLLSMLQRALQAGTGWTGEGRLIGASTWGDLVQVGEDIDEGCQAAAGRGLYTVVFEPGEPMGLGFAPEVPCAEVAAGREPAGDSVGTGAEVGEVEPGSTAEGAGVTVGMVARHLGDLALTGLAFEEVLEAIDGGRDAGAPVDLTFDTAAPVNRWYAVEMPATQTLAALAGVVGAQPAVDPSFAASLGSALLWQEPIPRLFLGAPGSVTCAHVDICPQIQLAHGLLGTKVLGVASREATARLLDEHGVDEEVQPATQVPTDRALSPSQTALLTDPDLSLVLLGPGDLAVLHSGALHFASNGAEGLSGAVYHGILTPAVLPDLRAAAAVGRREQGDYAGHLFPADLLELVDPAEPGPTWYRRVVGDPWLDPEPFVAIEAAFAARAPTTPGARLVTRLESTGGVHCVAVAYLSPAAVDLALELGFEAVSQPGSSS